jgi:hypothetical protein
MDREFERDDYALRLLIEDMQRQGRSENDIEAAVRAASRRLGYPAIKSSRGSRRLGLLRRPARKQVR